MLTRAEAQHLIGEPIGVEMCNRPENGSADWPKRALLMRGETVLAGSHLDNVSRATRTFTSGLDWATRALLARKFGPVLPPL